jgi:pyruvate dehydrogenase E2 component (dihydrolipoamide acetyltransferase)
MKSYKERSIMAEKVLMPKAGITVEECIITEWVVKEGDSVSVGDILFHYETDKATFECESTVTGQVIAILAEEGDEVPVLEAVCVVGEPGESYSIGDASGKPSSDATAIDKEEPVVVATLEATLSGESPSEETSLGTTPSGTTSSEVNSSEIMLEQNSEAKGFIKISPRAKNAAIKSGVNPAYATPTGPAGRIIEGDIRLLERANFGGDLLVAPKMSASQDPNASEAVGRELQIASIGNEYEDIKFSSMRKATSKAMLTSLSTMAQVTNQHSFDATTLINLRKRIKGTGETIGLGNISYNDMIIYAVSRIIQNHPSLNAHKIDNNIIRRFKNVHIGIAVDTPKGLYVPVVRNANHLSLSEISLETKRVAGLCQEGNVTSELFQGGTFTISNLGALGVEMFTPVINPPQTAILGVCGITTKVRGTGNQLEGYSSMGLALTYDHCVIDGWPASLFLKELCEVLENFDLALMK